MFNTERNRNIANRMTDYLYKNINHEDMVADEKYFGTLPAKGDNLEINEDISPEVYNKAVNGESLFGTLPDLAPDDVPSKRVIGSGMDDVEVKKVDKSARKGKAVAVFKGQSEDLFGKGASGGRKPSSWVAFVKDYAKTNGVSYKQAMKDAKSSYASQKGSKDAKQPRVEVKQPLPVKSQMKPSDLMGGAKKPSAWVEHCKDYAKKHGVSYKEALTKAKSTYKK